MNFLKEIFYSLRYIFLAWIFCLIMFIFTQDIELEIRYFLMNWEAFLILAIVFLRNSWNTVLYFYMLGIKGFLIQLELLLTSFSLRMIEVCMKLILWKKIFTQIVACIKRFLFLRLIFLVICVSVMDKFLKRFNSISIHKFDPNETFFKSWNLPDLKLIIPNF